MSHIAVGMRMDKEGELLPDWMLEFDTKDNGKQKPRSLLERILFCLKSQLAMDKRSTRTTDDEAKHIAAEKIWIWLIHDSMNACEHEGIRRALDIEGNGL